MAKTLGGSTQSVEMDLPMPAENSSSAWSVDGIHTRWPSCNGSSIDRQRGWCSHVTLERESFRNRPRLPALFIHLFDNAYQELLYRRTEKELVFSLNHRVLQLNSLIDTGIEVSKLDQAHRPSTCPGEGGILTNASKGAVKITRGDTLQKEIFFPTASRSRGRRGSSTALRPPSHSG